MQFSDLPITSVTAAPVIPNEALETYVREFTAHLEKTNTITTSSVNNTLKEYLRTVSYSAYGLDFDDYWASISDKNVQRVETILAIGLQTVSFLTRRQPPTRTVFRDIAKVKVAETLLARFVE